jgi:hypothetical protein
VLNPFKPILNRQVRHSGKSPGVVCYDYRIQAARVGCNQQIVVADDSSFPLEVGFG